MSGFTDRRVIHICVRRADQPILEIEERVISARTSVALWGRRLQLRVEGGRRFTFERVRPQGAAAEFETMLAIAAMDDADEDEDDTPDAAGDGAS